MTKSSSEPAAVAYARLSQDRTGEGAGIDRQLADVRTHAARLGLLITHEYVDNDMSATSGVARPEFERMLSDQPPAIVVWHQDRLLRLTRDLERVISIGVPVYTVHAGTLDLSTPAGRAVARTVAAWSTYEGEQKSLRQQRANLQRAESGMWQFSRRPFGYARRDGRVEVVEAEAVIVREGFTRYIAGDSYYAIANDWNARQVPTFEGPWSMSRVRSMLRNPAYAGERWYKGEFVSRGDWQPVIDEDTWRAYLRIRSRRKRAGEWSTKTKHLGSGLYSCGVCGARVFARPAYTGDRAVLSYACTTGWCVQRKAEPVDALVRAVIVGRLSDQKILKRLAEGGPDTGPIEAERDALIQRRDDLAALLADGTLTAAAVREHSKSLTTRIDTLASQLDSGRSDSGIRRLAEASDVAAAWDLLPLNSRRQIIVDMIDVRIDKTAARRTFDPSSVVIAWREGL